MKLKREAAEAMYQALKLAQAALEGPDNLFTLATINAALAQAEGRSR